MVINICVVKPLNLWSYVTEISDGQSLLHCQRAAHHRENLPEGSGAHHFGNERMNRRLCVCFCVLSGWTKASLLNYVMSKRVRRVRCWPLMGFSNCCLLLFTENVCWSSLLIILIQHHSTIALLNLIAQKVLI